MDSMYPDGSVIAAGNSCRDPGNDGYFWCYTLNPAIRWERCDVDRCTDGRHSEKQYIIFFYKLSRVWVLQVSLSGKAVSSVCCHF